jgi:hypothetical protein
MPRHRRLSLLGLVLIALAACGAGDPITCQSSADCLQGGIPGTCRPSLSSQQSFCGFSDPSCPAPAHERWGVASGDGLAGTCVELGELDGGTPPAADAGPPPDYLRRLGGASLDLIDGVASSPDGATYVVGVFKDTTDLGTGPLTSAGNLDAFLVKLSVDGTVAWARRFGAADSEDDLSIAAAPDGDVVFAGNFTGTIDFGCGPKNAGTTRQTFLVRYSPEGACVWSSMTGGGVRDLALDAAGNVYLVGSFEGTASFGETSLSSQGGTDVFVARFAGSTGVGVWAERWGGASTDSAVAVAVEGDQLAIAADIFGDASFGGATLTNSLGAVAIAKYATATGAHIWSRQIGKSATGGFPAPGHATDLAIDTSGRVVVCGTFEGATDFGGGTVSPSGVIDSFIAAYAPTTGAHSWSIMFGASGNKSATAIATLPDGRVAVGGHFSTTAALGDLTLVSKGAEDAFLVTLSTAGVPESAQSWGGAADDSVGAIVGTEPPIIAGTFSASVDFGDFGGVATSSGGADVFVVRHDVP